MGPIKGGGISMPWVETVFSSRRRRGRRLAAVGLSLGLACAARGGEEVPPAIRSASEVAYPPFCVVDAQGRADGFSVELLRAAARAMGRTVEFRVGDWADVKAWLERGEIDALPLVGRTPEREAAFDFTVPYISLYGAIVVRDDETGIETIEDLKGRRVAVMRADNAEEFLRRRDRGIEIAVTPTLEHALRELSAGRHDAVIAQRIVAYRLVRELGLSNLRVIRRPIEEFRQDFCFAVRKGDAQTLALLNEGLAVVMADGTYRRLQSRWLGSAQLPSDRVIRVGGDHAYPPYEFPDRFGRPTGFNVDLMRAIARQVGVEVEIELGPWPTMMRALETGEIDALEGMYYSEERARRFDFTAPHSVQHYVAVTRADGIEPPETVAALAGRVIAVQEGDLMDEFLETHGIRDGVLRFATHEQAMQAVADGRADGALVARLTALEILRRHPKMALRMARRPIHAAEYCIAVARGNEELRALFDQGIAMVRDHGELRRIHARWLGAPTATPMSFANILRGALWIVVPLAILLVAALLCSVVLRQVMARRTRELRNSEARFRTLIEEAPLAIFVETEERFAYVNPAAVRLFGAKSPKDLLGRHLLEIIPPEMRGVFRDRLRRLNEARESVPRMEAAYLRLDGSRVAVESSAVPLLWEGKNGALIFALDIDERVAGRQRLHRLNELLRTIRDVNQLTVREVNETVLIRRACDILFRHGEYISTLIVLVDEEGRASAWAAGGEAERSESLRKMLAAGELPACCRDRASSNGPEKWGEACLAKDCPLIGRDGSGYCRCVPLRHKGEVFGFLVLVARTDWAGRSEEESLLVEIAADLAFALNAIRTERARLEAERQRGELDRQLVQAEKMEAVGRLAGGVAHDFNNLLMGVMGNVDLCREMLPPDHPARECLDEIMRAAERSSALTRQLLAFARRQTIAPQVLDLNRTISDMLGLLKRMIGENIELRWSPGAGIKPVKMDPGQVDQILANLCVNARDAISGTGRIEIETAMEIADESFRRLYPTVAPGEYVRLTIADTGCGMAPDVQAHIFEPFFTTKANGAGTGLGLATVEGIVKQNNGFIVVRSEPGKGSSFSIYLPVAEAAEEDKAMPEPNADAVPRGSETILLVEDDPTVCLTVERFLTNLGYTVLAADGPLQALGKADHYEGPIHLVITDVIMPGGNGREMMERISERRPGLRCIYMSGYTANVIAHHGVLEPGTDFLQKPISLFELARKVREVLDRKE